MQCSESFPNCREPVPNCSESFVPTNKTKLFLIAISLRLCTVRAAYVLNKVHTFVRYYFPLLFTLSLLSVTPSPKPNPENAKPFILTIIAMPILSSSLSLLQLSLRQHIRTTHHASINTTPIVPNLHHPRLSQSSDWNEAEFGYRFKPPTPLREVRHF